MDVQVLNEFKQALLEAPETELSSAAKRLIQQKWSNLPTALEILEVTDFCVFTSGSSDFTVGAMNLMIKLLLNERGMTYEQLVEQAEWRNIEPEDRWTNL